MRNELLSIGEVAHLKGVGIKALRYYERIGILRPAYVNPETGYRYYAPRQMNELDVIISCVQLGVPLKELTDYVSDQGVMDISALLDRAHGLAEEKLRTTQGILVELDGYRSEIAVQETLRHAVAPYERALGLRTFLTIPWSGSSFDARRYTKAMTELYSEAKRSGLVPLFLQGMALLPGERGRAGDGADDGGADGRRWHVALEACPLPGEESAAVLYELPERTYSGRRIVRETFEQCYNEAFAQADAESDREEVLLALEVWDAELRTDRTVLEVLRG